MVSDTTLDKSAESPPASQSAASQSAADRSATDLLDPNPPMDQRPVADLPVCLTRDNLTSPYFPGTSRSLLAAVAVLCAVYLAVSIHRLNHTDLWGHMNFGRWIVQHGELPTADPFGSEPLADSFVNVPWLSQVLGYLTYQSLGAEGLVFAHAILVTASCGLLMLAIARRGVPPGWAVMGGATAILLCLPVVGTIRPQLFGMLGVPIVLAGLAAARSPLGRTGSGRTGSRWLPAGFAGLFIVWANLHGSFAIGLLLIGLFAVAETASTMLRTRSPRETAPDANARWAWLILVASVVGSCINPLGPWLLLEVARFGGHAPLEAITEWQTLTPWSMSGGLFFGSLVLTIFVMRASRLRLNAFEMLTLAVFGLLALSAMRMLVWWAFILPWVIAPYAVAAWQRRRQAGAVIEDSRLPSAPRQETPRQEAPSREASMRTLIAIAVVFMTMLLAPPTQSMLTAQPRGPARVLRHGTPLYVAEELQRRGLEGSILAPMEWADYLVWKTDGRVRPLVYSHVHLVPAATWDDYRRIAAGDAEWRTLARSHNLRYLVVDRTRSARLARLAFADAYSSKPAVRVIYQDQRSMLVELLARDVGMGQLNANPKRPINKGDVQPAKAL